MIAITKEARQSHWNFSFEPGDILLFGNETMGLPPKLIKYLQHAVKIPMWGESVRSLNLSNAVAIIAYEAYRQFSVRNVLYDGDHKNALEYKRTYYKRK